MRQVNPFSVFCPPKAKYFVLESFAAKDGKKGVSYDWYYSNGRNQFWPILESVYGTELKDITAQQNMFAKLSMAIADIILECERIGNSSLDTRLTNFVYNTLAIATVLKENAIEKIFFTSRFVETHYKRHFKDLVEKYPAIELIILPSPSPRYAAMRKEDKVKRYAEVLPGL